VLRALPAITKISAVFATAAVLWPGAAQGAEVAAGQRAQSTPIAGTLGLKESSGAAQGRIMGGGPIPMTDAPWQVRVNGNGFSCGGSILNATHVLTAAHCAEDIVAGQPASGGGLEVIAGRVNAIVPAATEQQRVVSALAVHPDYTRGEPVDTTGDLAVLTLATPLTLGSPEVRAIALPAPWTPVSAPAPVPAELRVTGYGYIDNNKNTDDLLRAVTTAPSDPDLCSANAENAIAICARSPLGSSCQGDSGGPLVTVGANPVQVGVVSNGGLCGPGTDDFYVNLLAPENRVFIDNALTNGSAPLPRAPRGLTEPTLTGPSTFRAGDTVTCNAGAFSNTPTEIRIEFTKDDGTVLQSTVGPSAQLKLPDSAVGSRLTCRPFATNAGGTYVGLRFTTNATVGVGPVVPTPPAGGGAGSVSGGLASQCPSSLDAAATFAVTVKAPKSARRGQKITVTISRLGPPNNAHAVVVGVGGPKKLLVTGSAAFSSTGLAARDNELQEYVKLRVRIPRTLKVGKTYSFDGTMLVANTVDEIESERVCEYGSKRFKVRIKR
jgi:Trypsin